MDSEDLITMLLLLLTFNGKDDNSKTIDSDTDKESKKEYGIIL